MKSQKLNQNSFEKLPEKLDKPVLIYLKTSWCSICKIQIFTIEKDSKLINTLNKAVDFIVFDTEQTKQDIKFLRKTFSYINNGNSGIHELAIHLSNSKQPIYPTWIMIDTNYQIKFYHQGLLSKNAIKNLLKN